jgi:hypothetical protein
MTAQSQPSAVARLEVKQELYRSESLTSKALRRLRRDTLTIVALAVLLVLIILTNLAPVIERRYRIHPHLSTLWLCAARSRHR